MSFDEVARVLFYASILPGFVVIGVLAWNGQLRASDLRLLAVLLWIAGCVFGLQMLGLVLLRMGEPRQGLLYLNTVLIGCLAVLPWVLALRRVVSPAAAARAVGLLVAAGLLLRVR